jgi:[ribosomal protein S5]-alanine N-acetyltransferase
MSKLPTFHTSRLILRELIESDVAAYEKYFLDYNVVRTITASVPWPYPKGGILEYVRTQILPNQGKDKWAWAITLKEFPEELIGVVDLWRNGCPENRGFWLAHKHWGKGYMTEAVEPVMDYAFDALGFEKLIFNNAVGNPRSARIKEKTGAKFVRREPAKFIDPALSEHEVYELTSAEWREFNRKRGVEDNK